MPRPAIPEMPYRPSTRSSTLIGLSRPRRGFRFGGGERLVMAGDRGVDVGGRLVRAVEIGDLLHLGDPAIGLVVHPRDARAQVFEDLRLARDNSASSASAQPNRAAPSIIAEPSAVIPLVIPA